MRRGWVAVAGGAGLGGALARRARLAMVVWLLLAVWPGGAGPAGAQDGSADPPAAVTEDGGAPGEAGEDTPETIRERALEALKNGDLPTAAHMLQQLGDRGVPQGYTLLGEIKRDFGDHRDAARWFERGAEGGDVMAMVQGGEILTEPRYGIIDPRRAYKLWRSAAEKDSPRGKYELGRALMTGTGVRRDEAQAADWLEKAARQCYAPAQLAYALILREGRGRTADGEAAFAWIIAAQRASDSWSDDELERLASLESEIPAYMSSAQVKRAYCAGLDRMVESCGGGGPLLAIERWLACK